MPDIEPRGFQPPVEQRRVPRGHPWIAWVTILAVVAWVVARRSEAQIPDKKVVGHRLQTIAGDLQSRYLVGALKLSQQKDSEVLLAAAAVDRGTIEQLLRNVVLIGEVRGAKDASKKLPSLEKSLGGDKVSDDDRSAAEILARLYGDLAEGKTSLPSIEPADREKLIHTLGWSGRLALHPADGPDAVGRQEILTEARRTFVLLLVLLAAFALLALVGLVALTTIVLLLLARPQSRALPPSTHHGGVYAETFAVWMATYVALGYTARWLPVGRNQFWLPAVIMLVSLATLAWPVMRGLAWRTVREDIGLRLGPKPLVELILGPVAYLAAIPLAVVGLLIVVALMAVTHGLPGEAGEVAPDSMPYHPIVGWLLKADWWEKLQVVFLAACMAPLVEETMFRGVLYRHLRDATSRLGCVGSVLASALVTSFVFAAIHPQGWIAIPALMGLAVGFTLAREWRGTLMPAVIAHGINNGLLTWVLISMGSA